MSATQAERDVAAAIRYLSLAVGRLPKALANLVLLTPDGYPGGGSEATSGGEEPDPTCDAVVAGLAMRELHGRIVSLAAEAKGIATELEAAIALVPDVAVDTASDAARLRCSGGEGDWADVTCTRIAVRNIESLVQGGQRVPLCWSCISRRRRWLEQQRTQAAS